LRHPLEDLLIAASWYGEMEGRVLRSKPPKVVEFRRDANLQETVDAITSHPNVLVNAAVGAGKSVRVPSVVAEKSGKLVIQIFPGDLLADDISRYVASLGEDIRYVGVHDPWPDHGVAAASAATLIGKWLVQGKLSLPECVLMHDESHESDAYTYVIKNIWPKVVGVTSYVCTTATSGPDGFRAVEAAGGLQLKSYDPAWESKTWDVFGTNGMPWEVASIRENVLIFEDSKDEATRLVADYRRAGVEAYRLHSRMKRRVFRSYMDQARTAPHLVVLVADSSFRSGFTMPVGSVIDTAKVARLRVVEGKPVREYREAYALERYQAAGRGGRIKGRPAVAWSPSNRPPAVVCHLEEVEAEAAALIFRIFRLAPPVEIIDAEMSEGPVPLNIVEALQEMTPLATLLPQKLSTIAELKIGRPESPHLRPEVVLEGKESLDFKHPAVSADVSRMRAKVAQIDPRRDSGVIVSDDGHSVVTSEASSGAFAEVFDKLLKFGNDDVVTEMEPGKYYFATGLEIVSTVCPAFPDAHNSVYKFLSNDRSHSLHHGLSSRDRSVAVAALVARHNMCSCEVNAIVGVVKDLGALADGRDPVAFRAWVHDFTSKVGNLQAEMRLLESGISKLAQDFCGLREAPPFKDEENMIAEALLGGLRVVPRLREVDVADRSVVSHQVRASLQYGDYGGQVSRFASVSTPEAIEFGHTPMEYKGRGMRASRQERRGSQSKVARWMNGSFEPKRTAKAISKGIM